MKKEKAKTKLLAEDLVYTTFTILKENNNEAKRSFIIEEIPKKIKLDDWAMGILTKSGYVRWQSVLQFYIIDCVKAGFILKNNSTWYLTSEGEEALKLGKEQLLLEANNKYREWKDRQATISDVLDNEDNDINKKTSEKIDIIEEEIVLDDIKAKSVETISSYINNLNPYEFQDLCSALLHGMGYYTPFIAPKGKDGGVDIIAYKDPLGATTPRIKIQVKHRCIKATAQEVRELFGILKSDDIGVFISTGGFTPDAINETKVKNAHVELIDLDRFIELWIEFFPKMRDEDKNLMPIKAVWLLDK